MNDDLPPDPFPPKPRRPRALWTPTGWAVQADVDVVPLNLDDPDLAEWCDNCALPSAVGYRFRILVNDAPISTALTLTICHDCGATARRMT